MTKTTQRGVNADAIRPIYLFSALSAAQLERVAGSAQRMTFDPGHRLFEQGDPITRFYYVENGRIKLYRLSPAGDEKVIDLVGPGQTFAEAVMFMPRAAGYPVHADALVATGLIGFDTEVFLALLRESNETCFELMSVMSRRLRAHVNEIDRLALQNATARFIGYILSAAGDDHPSGRRVDLTVPKNVLASRLSIQPETFSRILSRLTGAGLIEVDRQSVTLVDLDGLYTLLSTPH